MKGRELFCITFRQVCLYVNAFVIKEQKLGLPCGAVVENLPANARDTGSSPGLGRSHMPQSN